MGIRTMVGHEYGSGSAGDMAILYCSTTGIPLPIEFFVDDEGEDCGGRAEQFLEDATDHFDQDLRRVRPDDLRKYQTEWFNGKTNEQNERTP